MNTTKKTNLEKVIKGLECRTKKPCIYEDTNKECPYWEMCDEYFEDCTTALAKDALALLKAHEPRVMTLEEVEAMPYGHVLIETDKKDSLRWLDALLFSKNANYSFDFITLEGRARLLGTEYNREWRCWTSRPTDEQREATAWN